MVLTCTFDPECDTFFLFPLAQQLKPLAQIYLEYFLSKVKQL